MVTTNRPIAVKDVAKPAANAMGPNLCSATAAPNTTGVRGNTHGDSTENNPASSASGRVVTPMAFSQGLSQEWLDHFRLGFTDCPLNFRFVAVKDEHGDIICVDLPKIFLVCVVVRLEDHDILEILALNEL